MDEAIFQDKLHQLREGRMDLPAPDRNEIGTYARKHHPDLLAYTAALEAGYRKLYGRLSAYRNVAGERALGRIVKNQWSSPAALGYAAAALRQSGMNPSQVVGVLELMEELMDENQRAWAEGVYKEMVEDPGGNGGTDCRGKHGGQGKREQRQQPGGLLRAVADGYAGSDNPCICADSGRPTPRDNKAGDGA